MNYRKIPFYGTKSATMDGLTPIVPKRIKPGFGPMFPNSSMLGDIAPTTTVIMRPQPNAPAGFPGFFAWLKAEQPALYNYAKVALPAQVTQAEGHRTGGATLSGLGLTTRPPTPRKPRVGFFGEEQANNDNGIINDRDASIFGMGAFSESGFYGEETSSNANGVKNGLDPLFSRPRYVPALSGLGDDDSSDLSTIDTSSFDLTASTPIPTVSIPDTNAETSSVGVPPSPTASTVAQIVTTLTAAAPAVLSDINSQTVFNAQLARAQAGLPPLNTAAYGIGTALTSLGSMGPVLLIALGIGAVVLLGKK